MATTEGQHGNSIPRWREQINEITELDLLGVPRGKEETGTKTTEGPLPIDDVLLGMPSYMYFNRSFLLPPSQIRTYEARPKTVNKGKEDEEETAPFSDVLKTTSLLSGAVCSAIGFHNNDIYINQVLEKLTSLSYHPFKAVVSNVSYPEFQASVQKFDKIGAFLVSTAVVGLLAYTSGRIAEGIFNRVCRTKS